MRTKTGGLPEFGSDQSRILLCLRPLVGGPGEIMGAEEEKTSFSIFSAPIIFVERQLMTQDNQALFSEVPRSLL